MVTIRDMSNSAAKGCVHFTGSAKENALLSYKIVYKYIIRQSSDRDIRLAKSRTCICHMCLNSSPYLLACLSCVSLGCLFPNNHHIIHYQNTGHAFAAEVSYGNIYCMECSDFIYQAEVDKLSKEIDQQMQQSRKKNGVTQYCLFEPKQSEINLLREHPKRRLLESNSTIGLIGIYNLGNTCFMNCILQALAHTPFLRNYFLSSQHSCTPEQSLSCVVCTMINLFQKVYSGDSGPLIPYTLLYLIWMNARNLAGYEQQDAHEFFISALDVLHRQSVGQQSRGTAEQLHSFVDRVFGGKLQSDVVCQSCNGVSTKIDPFRDISLDLSSNLSPRKTRPYPGKMMPLSYSLPSDLGQCLDRFTQSESLGSESKIHCESCKSNQLSTKKMTFHQLPLVFSFHLKRFEHSQQSRKISKFISFPEELDMSPFLEDSISQAENDNKYSLFCVVNHHGSINNGHYTCFVRHREEDWFNCDDAWITKASKDDVLHSEGYLLFYHKKVYE